MSDLKPKKLNTVPTLEDFVLAIIYAHGDMITTAEAEDAIKKAFKEYRDSQLVEPRTAAGSLD